MIDFNALAFLQPAKVLPPSDVGSYLDLGLRWIHLLAGITWIGLLYFFNLVNVGFMKKLDAPTKGKVIPALLPSALWWFRWGAMVTVLAGFIYWVLFLHQEPQPPDGTPGQYLWRTLGIWLVVVVVAWFINYFLLRIPVVTKNGWWVALFVTLLAAGIFYLNTWFNTYDGISNRVASIAVGGGYGVFMLLNVWGIIWPAQKRIIAWTKENAEQGTAIPAESAALARRAFLASRANTWLSLPMLFFMAAASHFPMFTGG
ncbi:urate hydroxylase PuuD [Acidobacteriia bacterium AH_259_A11_L15]|nr:urate hydroxylase PuuD [Acidobacteriia bacterium AH_259_A11_L15]